MTFLGVLGNIVKYIGIAEGFIPLVQQAVPGKTATTLGTIQDKLNQGLGVIVTTEQAFTNIGKQDGSGPDKLKAAAPFIAQLIQQTDLLTGKKPKDEAAFIKATTDLTSALADVLNSY